MWGMFSSLVAMTCTHDARLVLYMNMDTFKGDIYLQFRFLFLQKYLFVCLFACLFVCLFSPLLLQPFCYYSQALGVEGHWLRP